MPEVSLVAILDADQEGFLRSDRSLIQTVGRAARHVNGRAIFYADRVTGSMQRCMEETARRRDLQRAHNEAHGITPRGVAKSADQVRFITRVADARTEKEEGAPKGRGRGRGVAEPAPSYDKSDLPKLIARLEGEMKEAAAALDFETAARLRDELFELRASQDGERPRRGAAAGGRAER